VALLYLEGQAVESLSRQFSNENASVNVSSCEFLEILVTHLDVPALGLILLKNILLRLIRTLSHHLLPNDYVLQIQVVNLFKAIFFGCAPLLGRVGLAELQPALREVLGSRVLVASCLAIVASSSKFVRGCFLQLIQDCLPLFARFL